MKAERKPTHPDPATQPKKGNDPIPQPEPFTPGVTKAMVRQHAYGIYRDKLAHDALTLEDWVLAEKDLVNSLESDNLPK